MTQVLCKPVILNVGWHGTPLQGGVNKFPGFESPHALYNMESLINRFTKKCICFYISLKVRGLETKNISLKESYEKRLRTTGLNGLAQLCPTRGPVEGFVRPSLGFSCSESILHIDNLSLFW